MLKTTGVVKPYVIKVEQVNTCNGWGFGGWVGTITVYSNGLTHHKGRNHHRHTPSSDHNDWYYRDPNGQEFAWDAGSSNGISKGKLWLLSVKEPNERSPEYRLISATDEEKAYKLASKYYNDYLHFDEEYTNIKEIILP